MVHPSLPEAGGYGRRSPAHLIFTVANDQLQVSLWAASASSIEYLSCLPHASAKGLCLDATVTAKNTHRNVSCIKKLTALVSYVNNSIDMYVEGVRCPAEMGHLSGRLTVWGSFRFCNFSITRHCTAGRAWAH